MFCAYICELVCLELIINIKNQMVDQTQNGPHDPKKVVKQTRKPIDIEELRKACGDVEKQRKSCKKEIFALVKSTYSHI